MADFGLNEMLEMQKALQDKYKDKWKPICPERGKDQLLWMIGEIGEAILLSFHIHQYIIGKQLIFRDFMT